MTRTARDRQDARDVAARSARMLGTSVVVKMALGEAPDHIPVFGDVRRGRADPSPTLDGGVVDRLVRAHAGGVRVSRVHAAARALRQAGARHLGFSDAEHVFGLARTFRFEVGNGTLVTPLIDALSQVTTVEAASPNYLVATPFAAVGTDDDAWEPWAVVRAAEALAREPGDSAVVVAIVDSGVAPEHPDLPPLRSGYDTVELGREELGAGFELVGDVTGADRRPIDHHVGHGMACAGIIGALGLGMPTGLGGASQLLPLRALAGARFAGKAQAVGIGATTDLDAAVKLAVDLGAKVLNMSFGTDDRALAPLAPKPHAEVVAYALDRGCVLVAASGNNGERTVYWPAAYPGVIAVGASGADGRPTAFSTRGDHVALCAPGRNILSLGLTDYQSVTGTSFAAPFVAATAALLVARAQRRSTPLDAEMARDLMVRSATPFTGGAEPGCGAGILNAAAALEGLDAWIDRSTPEQLERVEDG
jgi:subtilisin family serine protease